MSNDFEKVRDKDHIVLDCIREGRDDVQKITEATTLNNSGVNYCFRKLSKLEMIEVEKPEGMVERVIDGTRQVFEAPKRAELTRKAHEYFEWIEETERGEQYRDMTREEMVEQLQELEETVEKLDARVEGIRQDVSDFLLNSD